MAACGARGVKFEVSLLGIPNCTLIFFLSNKVICILFICLSVSLFLCPYRGRHSIIACQATALYHLLDTPRKRVNRLGDQRSVDAAPSDLDCILELVGALRLQLLHLCAKRTP